MLSGVSYPSMVLCGGISDYSDSVVCGEGVRSRGISESSRHRFRSGVCLILLLLGYHQTTCMKSSQVRYVHITYMYVQRITPSRHEVSTASRNDGNHRP